MSYVIAAVILLLAIVFLAGVIPPRTRRKDSDGQHDHGDHDHGVDWDSVAKDFDPVHEAKDVTGGCKFDPEEVRRTALLQGPPIDMDNIPAPDARVAALLNQVDAGWVRDRLMKLSGGTPANFDGKSVTIRSRNSFTDGVGVAMDYVESFYRDLGIAVRRIPYRAAGRTFFDLEATIPGKKNPKKVLIVGAHLDSTAGWTRSKEKEAPGADDDASGTVAVMQIAAALAQLPLDYTVRIVHFTGEEQGLWGSMAYSDMLNDEVKKDGVEVIGMLQHDMVGYSPNTKARLDVHDEKDRNGSRSLLVLYFRNVKRYGIALNPYDTHNYAVRNRSDHAGFLNHGFKAIMFSEEFTDEGFNPNYHQTSDTVDKLNIPFIVEVIKGGIALSADLAGIQPE